MTMDCDHVRELYFELRHGRIDGPTQTEMEEHLLGCVGCRDHLDKLDGMLDEAILWRPSDQPLNRDRLFESILQEVGEKSGSVIPLVDRSSERRPMEEPRRSRRAVPWVRVVLAAAALIVATLSWPKVILEFVSGDSDSIFKELGAEDTPFLPWEPTHESETTLPEKFVGAAQIGDALRVFPGPQARWEVTADTPWSVELHSGQLLIELGPIPEELEISFPGGKARTSEAVVLVEDTGRITALEGSLYITVDGETSRPLLPGEHWQGFPEGPGGAPAGPLTLRMEAERALRSGQFHEAAEHYEELLTLVPPTDRVAGGVRLRLGRLYSTHLNNPEAGIEHFQWFVRTFPDDPSTPWALAELCDLGEYADLSEYCRQR